MAEPFSGNKDVGQPLSTDAIVTRSIEIFPLLKGSITPEFPETLLEAVSLLHATQEKLIPHSVPPDVKKLTIIRRSLGRVLLELYDRRLQQQGWGPLSLLKVATGRSWTLNFSYVLSKPGAKLIEAQIPLSSTLTPLEARESEQIFEAIRLGQPTNIKATQSPQELIEGMQREEVAKMAAAFQQANADQQAASSAARRGWDAAVRNDRESDRGRVQQGSEAAQEATPTESPASRKVKEIKGMQTQIAALEQTGVDNSTLQQEKEDLVRTAAQLITGLEFKTQLGDIEWPNNGYVSLGKPAQPFTIRKLGLSLDLAELATSRDVLNTLLYDKLAAILRDAIQQAGTMQQRSQSYTHQSSFRDRNY